MIQDIQNELFENDKSKIQKDIFKTIISLYREGNAFYIPGNVPSLKNSKEIFQMPTKYCVCGGIINKSRSGTFCTKCKKPSRKKRPVLVPSKTTQKYQKDKKIEYMKHKASFTKKLIKIDKPFNIGFYFIRDTKRIYDLINALQIVQDMMVENHYIEDDNAYIIKPFFMGGHVDKENAGVFIVLLPNLFEQCYDILSKKQDI